MGGGGGECGWEVEVVSVGGSRGGECGWEGCMYMYTMGSEEWFRSEKDSDSETWLQLWSIADMSVVWGK